MSKFSTDTTTREWKNFLSSIAQPIGHQGPLIIPTLVCHRPTTTKQNVQANIIPDDFDTLEDYNEINADFTLTITAQAAGHQRGTLCILFKPGFRPPELEVQLQTPIMRTKNTPRYFIPMPYILNPAL